MNRKWFTIIPQSLMGHGPLFRCFPQHQIYRFHYGIVCEERQFMFRRRRCGVFPNLAIQVGRVGDLPDLQGKSQNTVSYSQFHYGNTTAAVPLRQFSRHLLRAYEYLPSHFWVMSSGAAAAFWLEAF
jgi:hypothetical protein